MKLVARQPLLLLGGACAHETAISDTDNDSQVLLMVSLEMCLCG